MNVSSCERGSILPSGNDAESIIPGAALFRGGGSLSPTRQDVSAQKTLTHVMLSVYGGVAGGGRKYKGEAIPP